MKRAFIGLSTPIGYEYRHPIRERQDAISDIPNPFLESVNGLLLCYDELWFPSRDYCPVDLQALDYVHFLEDSAPLRDRALVAIEQAEDAFAPEDIPEPDGQFLKQQWQAVWDRVPDIALDNHGRPSAFGTGNSADGRLFSKDLLIAASLEFEVDIIVNSALASSIHALHVGANVKQMDSGFVPRAVEEITSIHSLDFVTKTGSYHESVEELRNHERITEFRQFLSQEAPNQKDFVALVAEVNRQVDGYAEMAMRKFLKGNAIFSVGSATVGVAGNLVQPGAGSLLSGVLNAGKWLKDDADRKKVAWSMFVLDIKKNQSSVGRR